MSFTDNLVAFNTQIEAAIGEIPPEKILNDPNIYRLVKLLSWSKQASGAAGSGGGGSSSLTAADITSGIDNSQDINEVLLFLESLDSESLTLRNLSQSILNNSNMIIKGSGSRNPVFDLTINNNSSGTILTVPGTTSWLSSFTMSVSEPCLIQMRIDNLTPFYQVLNQQGIEKIYKYPIRVTGSSISIDISEAANPVRVVGTLEVEEIPV